MFLFLPVHNIGLSTSEAPSENWKLIKEKGDIKVFVDRKDQGFDGIKIKATIYTSLSTFIEYINNVSKYTDWVYACVSER
jgi:hypothetical protein